MNFANRSSSIDNALIFCQKLSTIKILTILITLVCNKKTPSAKK